MKKWSILIVVIVSVMLTQCVTQRVTQREPAYVVPEEITGKTRENLVAMLEYGQKLYKIKCAKCHGIFTKGKDSIPNFSKTQLENYAAQALVDDPKNHAVIQKMTTEDLDMVLQFLNFRKMPAATK
jgi:cytochrome c553